MYLFKLIKNNAFAAFISSIVITIFLANSVLAQVADLKIRVLDVKIVQGTSSVARNIGKRVQSASFRFYEDSSFVFDPTYDSPRKFFPLTGSFSSDDDFITFEAKKLSTDIVSSTVISIVGEISFEDGSSQIRYYSASGTSFCGTEICQTVENTPAEVIIKGVVVDLKESENGEGRRRRRRRRRRE